MKKDEMKEQKSDKIQRVTLLKKHIFIDLREQGRGEREIKTLVMRENH